MRKFKRNNHVDLMRDFVQGKVQPHRRCIYAYEYLVQRVTNAHRVLRENLSCMRCSFLLRNSESCEVLVVYRMKLTNFRYLTLKK